MHGGVGTEQDGADGGAVVVGFFHQVERDVGGVNIGHDQQVGAAFEGGVRVDGIANALRERRVAVHFAVAFQFGGAFAQDGERFAHFARRGGVVTAEVGMR